MPTQMLPPDIAQRQIVKFTKADRDAFRLVGGIAAMPPSHVLPDTLPEPPGIPPLPDLAYIEEQVSAALSLDVAMQEIRTGAGRQFDPELSPVFLEILEGTTVRPN